MKKITILLILLIVTGNMHAQDRTQPKPGIAPVVHLKKPQTFQLPNGLKVLVVENHKLPKVSFTLSIDNPPFAEADKKGVDDLCSSLIGNGSTKIAKDAFNEEVDFMGASISFSSHGAKANALSRYAVRALELMSFGALYPDFTQKEFDKEKAKIIESLKSEEKSVPAIASRVVDALAFGTNHPSGEFVTIESLNNVTLEDVKKLYDTHFSPENAYLVIVGDVKFVEIKPSIEKLFGSWKKTNIPKLAYADPKNVATTQIDFVDVPNAVQSEIAVVNTFMLKMNSKDFFPAVLASTILGGEFNSYLNMNLREKNGWTYGANTSMGAGKYVTKVRSSSAVRNAVTDSATVEIVKEIKRLRTEKVTEERLNAVKAGFIGRFVMQSQKPQSVARYALNTEIEQLPKDFYENYIKTITAVTPEEIIKAANKYFLVDNSRIIIVGKGEEVLPGLEKLGIPIYYFDKYGKSIEKPIYQKK